MIDGDASALSGRTTASDRPARPRRTPTEHRDPLARRSHDLVGLIKGMKDEPAPRAVHRLRTTIRRVETLLSAADDAAGAERKVRKQLDRLRKRAGDVRDVDVHLKALRSLPRDCAAEDGDTLRRELKKARDKRAKRLARALGDERDRGLVKRLRRVVARVVPPATSGDADRALAAVLADFAAAHREQTPLGVANLHDFRIATKRLRYRAEALAPHEAAAVAERALKRAQDAIGVWHDWVTLHERAVEELKSESPVVTAIAARAAAELAKACDVVARVARRPASLPRARRKGVRREEPQASVLRQSAGASA